MPLYRISRETFRPEEISKKEYEEAKKEFGRDYPNFLVCEVKTESGNYSYDEALFTSKLEAIDAQIKNIHDYFAQAKCNYLNEMEELTKSRKIELQKRNI